MSSTKGTYKLLSNCCHERTRRIRDWTICRKCKERCFIIKVKNQWIATINTKQTA